MFSSNSVQSSQTNRVHPSTLYTGSTKKYNHIVKIERIQNSTLYTQYMARKRIMDQQNSPGIENEMELFHGCPSDVTDKISYQGFNRSFAGKNGIWLLNAYTRMFWKAYHIGTMLVMEKEHSRQYNSKYAL